MNSDKVCVYENEQSNVYEKINKQNTETAEYDTLNVVKTGNKNDHWISPRVLVCALAVNVVVIISLLILGTAVIMELSNEVSSLSKHLKTPRPVCKTVQQNGNFSKTDYHVAFTATEANDLTPIVFTKSMYNVGGCYDNTTGKFIAPIPGIYYFASTMTKQYGDDIDYIQCSLSVNSDVIVGTMADPYGRESDQNGYSLSMSGTFHLEADDIVYVGCDSDASALISSLCSFTGFLVAADDVLP